MQKGSDSSVATGAGCEPSAFQRQVDTALASLGPAIDAYLVTKACQAAVIAPEAATLWTALGSQIGGKLVRPRLTLAAYLGCGGTDLDQILPAMAAQEILHTAMLIHDDLLDGDEIRRGQPNLAGRYRALANDHGYSPEEREDVVQAASLLGGDLAIAAAVDIVLQSTLDPGLQVDIVSVLVRAIHTTVAGELLDVLAQGNRSVVPPETISAFKTAFYTCRTPLALGALVAGAPDIVRDGLHTFGEHLGIAFQIADDYHGVFGRPEKTGKSVLSDLRRGKWTVLLAVAWDRVNADQAALLSAYVGRRDLTESQASQVRDVFVAVGADRAARDALQGHLARAQACLGASTAPELITYLSHLADRIDEGTR